MAGHLWICENEVITDEDLYPSKYNATYNCITQKKWYPH